METGSCPELLALSAFFDEELHERKDEEIKLHIQNCPDCKKQIKRLDVADGLIRRLLAEPMTLSGHLRKSDCITPEVMTAYLHDLLPVDEKRRVDGHIDGCDACLSELDSLTKSSIWLEQSKAEPLPDVLRKRVEGFWAEGQKDREPIFRLVLRLAKDGLEVLRDTLVPETVVVQEVFAPAGAYRSGERSSLPSGVLLKKSLPGIEVTVILEWRSNSQAQLRTKIEDDQHQAVADKRVFVRRNETLIFSDKTSADGVVVVPDLEIGSYELGIVNAEKDFHLAIEITNT